VVDLSWKKNIGTEFFLELLHCFYLLGLLGYWFCLLVVVLGASGMER
jgi:hypothetical protein